MWKRILCAFTWHSWMLVGIRGPFVLYVCRFCKSKRWRVL